MRYTQCLDGYIKKVILAISKKERRQKDIAIMIFEDLLNNLQELKDRKSEGEKIIDEFFDYWYIQDTKLFKE